MSAAAILRLMIAPIAVDCLIRKDKSLIVTLISPINDLIALMDRFLQCALRQKVKCPFCSVYPTLEWHAASAGVSDDADAESSTFSFRR
jgi:hypothetical protein